MLKGLRCVFIILILALLYGCKVELYSGLPEQEGNEMLALLLKHGIDSEKQLGKDNVVNLFIDESQTARAVDLLSRHGYPRTQFSTIKDIFSDKGLVSTPFEERTRYIYGLSQEVSETLSKIDGVLIARVHVVLPEESKSNSGSRKLIFPASASVFIKYNTEYDLASYIPQMKTIVSNAIEGLSYEQVSVSLFPAKNTSLTDFYPAEYSSVLWLKISPDSVGHFYFLLSVLLILFFSSIAGGVYLYVERQRPAAEMPAQSAIPAVSTEAESVEREQGSTV